MASIRIRVPQFDNGVKLIFTVTIDNMVANLQNATVIFKMKHTSEERTIIRETTIVDASMGECEYILTSEDTSVSGGYLTELETRLPNGTILSMDNPAIIAITPELIE